MEIILLNKCIDNFKRKTHCAIEDIENGIGKYFIEIHF